MSEAPSPCRTQADLPHPSDRRMLLLLAQGRPVPLIARDLGISRASVNRRLLALRREHGAAHNIQLAAIAARQGWV